MISLKVCAYRTTTVNILPALLFTPVYATDVYCPLFTRAEWIKWGLRSHEERSVKSKIPYASAGFRLSFKFINIHLGIEVRYVARRIT